MKKTFTIKVTMEERWIDTFMTMLKRMETLGRSGSSMEVGIYADGDSDFQPEFEADVEWKETEAVKTPDGYSYDAG